jgi:hypothetical protein
MINNDFSNNFSYPSPFGKESLFNIQNQQTTNTTQSPPKPRGSKKAGSGSPNTRKKTTELKYGVQVKIENGDYLVYYDENLYEKGVLYKGNDVFAIAVREALNSLLISPMAFQIINDLQNAAELFNERPVYGAIIVETTEKGEFSSALINRCSWNYKNPFTTKLENKKDQADAAINLIHELGHVYRYNTGEEVEDNTLDSWNLLQEEEEETSHLENVIRAETGRLLRWTYGGEPIIDESGKRIYGESRWDYRLKAKNTKK